MWVSFASLMMILCVATIIFGIHNFCNLSTGPQSGLVPADAGDLAVRGGHGDGAAGDSRRPGTAAGESGDAQGPVKAGGRPEAGERDFDFFPSFLVALDKVVFFIFYRSTLNCRVFCLKLRRIFLHCACLNVLKCLLLHGICDVIEPWNPFSDVSRNRYTKLTWINAIREESGAQWRWH